MQQITIRFDAGLVDSYPTLKELVAARVHQQGRPQKAVAADLDLSPSDLSRANCKGDAKLDAFNKALDAVYDPEAARPLQDRAFLLAGDPIEVAARGPQQWIA